MCHFQQYVYTIIMYPVHHDIEIIIIMPLHSPIHACNALTLVTCWCALLPILSAGARFLVALTSAIVSDYLQEVQTTECLLWFDLKQIASELVSLLCISIRYLLNHIKSLPQYIWGKDLKNASI